MRLCWILIILFIATLLWSSQEHMSNKDLVDTLKTFGVDDNNTRNDTPRSKQEIYGPGTKIDEKHDVKAYPEIYGPEYVGAPTKPSGSQKKYDFNLNDQKSFPVNGPPTPFLTDFSKFQK